MSDTSRKKAIENLETLKAFLDINGVFTISDAMKKSIDFAIASLKTDEAYQLEYERTTKNNLGVDAVSRKDVHDMLENLPITVGDKWFNWLQKACMRLAELPTVTPQLSSGLKNGSPIIDWNNCHTSEQLDSIATPKNDLGVDCISRQAVIDNAGLSEWFDSSAQPKKGRWIYDYTPADGHRVYHCSECGCYLKPKHSESLDSFKWCSLCGADMREVEE